MIIQEQLNNFKGSQIIGIDTLTVVELTGGKANPQQGRVKKLVEGSKVMVFKSGKGYFNMVTRRLKKQAEGMEMTTDRLFEAISGAGWQPGPRSPSRTTSSRRRRTTSRTRWSRKSRSRSRRTQPPKCPSRSWRPRFCRTTMPTTRRPARPFLGARHPRHLRHPKYFPWRSFLFPVNVTTTMLGTCRRRARVRRRLVSPRSRPKTG